MYQQIRERVRFDSVLTHPLYIHLFSILWKFPQRYRDQEKLAPPNTGILLKQPPKN